MRLAEELYQAGYISYPRTETNQFDTQYDLRVCCWTERPFMQCNPGRISYG